MSRRIPVSASIVARWHDHDGLERPPLALAERLARMRDRGYDAVRKAMREHGVEDARAAALIARDFAELGLDRLDVYRRRLDSLKRSLANKLGDARWMRVNDDELQRWADVRRDDFLPSEEADALIEQSVEPEDCGYAGAGEE